MNPLGGGITSLSEATLRVAYAVFTGDPDVNYSTINGLTARIEGLDQWRGVRSVSTSLDKPSRNRSREMTVTIKKSTTTKVDALLNLTLVASADWQIPGGVGKTSIEDTGSTRTLVKHPRAWNEHLERHLAIHKLLEVSAWRPLGFHQIHAMHSRDPLRVLSGDVIGDRWASVHTYELPPAEGSSDALFFLFTYEDIGAAGVRRWLRLRDEFKRGIHAMTFSIRHRNTSLDGLVSDAGIGLEEISHQLLRAKGVTARKPHHEYLEAIADEVDDLLPFDDSSWATESTSVYNDVKHADRSGPTVEAILASLRQNRLVFRTWLARRLGVSKETIRKGQWLLERP